MKRWLLILMGVVCVFTTLNTNAQNVSVNRNGALPHSSAILDITATDAGILIPRMTEAEMLAISSPATGLMVFQTDGATGFKFYNGTGWGPVSSSMYEYTTQKTSTGTLFANTSWKVIPGMIDTVVLYADAKIMIWGNGELHCQSNSETVMTSADISLYNNNTQITGGGYTRVFATNDNGSDSKQVYAPFNVMTVLDLTAGTYILDMRARRIDTHGKSIAPRIGDVASNPRAASMIVQVHYK